MRGGACDKNPIRQDVKKPGARTPGFIERQQLLKLNYCTETLVKFCRPNGLTRYPLTLLCVSAAAVG